MEKAFDVNGTEIKPNDIVEVVNNHTPFHPWLQEGNTLRVRRLEDRSYSTKRKHIVVLLESKEDGKLCNQVLQGKQLLVVKEQS